MKVEVKIIYDNEQEIKENSKKAVLQVMDNFNLDDWEVFSVPGMEDGKPIELVLAMLKADINR